MTKKKAEKPGGKGATGMVPIEDPRELRKAVEAIHVATKVGLLQKKIMNNLVFYAYHELPNSEVHRVSLSKLAEDVGFDSNNVAFLKKQLRHLIDITVEWNVLKNGNEVWRASSMLAEAEIGEGMVSYSFPPMLRKMLYNPKVFSIINLHILKRFNSSYAYSLYENTFRFKNVESTGFIDIETWKKLLGVDLDSETYKEFKHFNAQILKPAINEVNEVTDILIEPEFQRTGKRVIAIRFSVKAKAEGQSDFAFPTDDQLKVDVLQRMLALGITEKTAHEYIGKYPLAYIDGNLAVVEDRIKSGTGKIKNYSAYFKKALEEDFRPGTAPIDVAMEEGRAAAKEKERLAKEEEAELAHKQSQRLTDAKQFFDSRSAKEKVDIEKKFVNFISEHNKMMYGYYQKGGLDGSKMVNATFQTWLADELHF